MFCQEVKGEMIGKKRSMVFINNVMFCVRALSKEKLDNRIHVTHLKIDKNQIIGTDGCRIHFFKYDRPGFFEPGLYQPIVINQNRIILIKSESNQEYPSIDIFNKPKSKDAISRDFYFSRHQWANSLSWIIRNLPEESAMINPRYVWDLEGDFTVTIDGDNNFIDFQNENKRACIMPMKW